MSRPYGIIGLLYVVAIVLFIVGGKGVLPGELGNIGSLPFLVATIAVFLITLNAILTGLAKLTRSWPAGLRKIIGLDRYDVD